MKKDLDFFSYINLKYGIKKEKKDFLDKINNFGEKIFINLFTVGGITEKINNKLEKLLSGKDRK